MVALPTVWFFVCPGAAPRAYSCFAHVRPCAQGRCGRCPLGFGVTIYYYSFSVILVGALHQGAPSGLAEPSAKPTPGHRQSFPGLPHLRGPLLGAVMPARFRPPRCTSVVRVKLPFSMRRINRPFAFGFHVASSRIGPSVFSDCICILSSHDVPEMA